MEFRRSLKVCFRVLFSKNCELPLFFWSGRNQFWFSDCSLFVEVTVGVTIGRVTVGVTYCQKGWSSLAVCTVFGLSYLVDAAQERLSNKMSNWVSTGGSGKILVTGTILRPAIFLTLYFLPTRGSLPTRLRLRTNKTTIRQSRNYGRRQNPVNGGLSELWYVFAQERGDIHFSKLINHGNCVLTEKMQRPMIIPSPGQFKLSLPMTIAKWKLDRPVLAKELPPPSQVWTRSSRQLSLLFCFAN